MTGPLLSLGLMVATPAVLALLGPGLEEEWIEYARVNVVQPD
jgi:hypothetical protein